MPHTYGYGDDTYKNYGRRTWYRPRINYRYNRPGAQRRRYSKAYYGMMARGPNWPVGMDFLGKQYTNPREAGMFKTGWRPNDSNPYALAYGDTYNSIQEHTYTPYAGNHHDLGAYNAMYLSGYNK